MTEQAKTYTKTKELCKTCFGRKYIVNHKRGTVLPCPNCAAQGWITKVE
jgi:predicted RNA-binding Zn-ribbon protein involved in translation (DUF1610 family)